VDDQETVKLMTDAKPPEDIKFEQALAELEQIVRDLEDGQIDLEASLSRYEQGVALLRHCYGQLRDAEQRILTLTGQTEEGEAILKPFAHAATAEGKTKGSSPPKKGTDLPLWKAREEQ
jgi:exodeoxyribonuclease VII small subunit